MGDRFGVRVSIRVAELLSIILILAGITGILREEGGPLIDARTNAFLWLLHSHLDKLDHFKGETRPPGCEPTRESLAGYVGVPRGIDGGVVPLATAEWSRRPGAREDERGGRRSLVVYEHIHGGDY